MGKHPLRLIASTLLVGIILPVYASAQTQQGPLGKIIGSIRIAKGDFPPRPVLVTLELRGAAMQSVYCDGQGRFGFYALNANQYRVSIDDDAYQPVSENVTVYPDVDPMNFVQFTLIPRDDKKNADPAQNRVSGSNPYLIDPAEYYRHFPKKTIHEFKRGIQAEKESRSDDAIAHYQKAIEYSPLRRGYSRNRGRAQTSAQLGVWAFSAWVTLCSYHPR